MKTAVLKEYGLTAKCFLERFNTMRKPFNDTFILFTSKLRGLLLQYFNARKVTSFDDVVSLCLFWPACHLIYICSIIALYCYSCCGE